MRCGLSLAMQHPMGEDLGQPFAELLETVRRARQAGFHHVSASQHYLATPFQYMPPVPVLARVAAEAGDMTLDTGIMLLALQLLALQLLALQLLALQLLALQLLALQLLALQLLALQLLALQQPAGSRAFSRHSRSSSACGPKRRSPSTARTFTCGTSTSPRGRFRSRARPS